ncbi:MAG: bifunctional hydroxymethylpyrimidine kinase/phosphomethylpyrimidine kinase [Nitrospirota bacterium]
MRPTALTIAGSDPSGGAGIQADIKTFARMGVYGAAVPAALTVQDTLGVIAVKPLPPDFIRRQLTAVLEDIKVGAAKTGMLLSSGAITAVADIFKGYGGIKLVVDPVTISSSGKRLLRKDAEGTLILALFPLAYVVTPNVPEAEALSGMHISNIKDLKEAAGKIKALGPRHVLIKGGHLPGEPVDILFDGRVFTSFPGGRITGKEMHGAGCVFSAAVTAGLARGRNIKEAVTDAKGFVTRLIKDASPVGKGRIPLL